MRESFYYVANWKMNMHFHAAVSFCTEQYEQLIELSQRSATQIVLCPSFPVLFSAAGMFKGTSVVIGAQDCSEHQAGAYTGDVSARSLHEIGVKFTIVGHSERRINQGETAEQVSQKVLRLYEEKITPIVCVGESIKEYEDGVSIEVIKAQLKPVFDAIIGMSPRISHARLLIAYEPVFAIGTGIVPENQHLEMIFSVIRDYVVKTGIAQTTHLLYGGSVNEKNASELKKVSGLQGFLIGGASTDFQMLQKIVLSN